MNIYYFINKHKYEMRATEVGLEFVFSLEWNSIEATDSQQSLFIGNNSFTICIIHSESRANTRSQTVNDPGHGFPGNEYDHTNKIHTLAILW